MKKPIVDILAMTPEEVDSYPWTLEEAEAAAAQLRAWLFKDYLSGHKKPDEE